MSEGESVEPLRGGLDPVVGPSVAHHQVSFTRAELRLILDLYGQERGLHARSAVGMAELPFNAPVEIETIVEIADVE